MKKIVLFSLLFVTGSAFAQFSDDFSDGDFTANPAWGGSVENFIVNSGFELQSNALTAATSYLSLPSTAIEDGLWELFCRITYNPSASNFAAYYVISDVADLSGSVQGYYIQIGGTNDNITLYRQQGSTRTRLIESEVRKKILDSNDNSVFVRLTRDAAGTFSLYSRLIHEEEFQLEGTVTDVHFAYSKYSGVYVRNSATTGKNYYFDNIFASGREARDVEPPRWLSAKMVVPNKIELLFSEGINKELAQFRLLHNEREVALLSDEFTPQQNGVTLTFDVVFDSLSIYALHLFDIYDLSGNPMELEQSRQLGFGRTPSAGELLLNELMFNPLEGGQEYVEVINHSGRLLDISDVAITTRKNDGTFNAGNRFPQQLLLVPHREVALCADAAMLHLHHQTPNDAYVVGSNWSQALHNEGTTLYLLDATRQIVLDSVAYSAKWHHPLIKNEKGVALERIHPELASEQATTWHSASSLSHYGTPGYKNSQFQDIHHRGERSKTVWLESESFTPDGDGHNDICIIRYAMPREGFVTNIGIYTPSGVLVAKVAESMLLSQEGLVLWDGTTVQGRNATIGVYVMSFEAFHATSGQRVRERLPVVVGGR